MRLVKPLVVFVTASLLLLLPASAFEHQDYVSKIFKASSSEALRFEQQVWQQDYYDKHVKSWVDRLELEFAKQVQPIEASIEFTLNDQGEIVQFNLLELKSNISDQAMKDFIAELLAFRITEIPKDMQDLVFKFDAKWQYLARNTKLEQLDSLIALEIEATKPSPDELACVDKLEASEMISAKLVSPKYIDYPRVGEELVVQVEDLCGLSLHARVVDVANKYIILSFNQFGSEAQTYPLKASTWIYRPNKRPNFAKSFDSGLTSALSLGLPVALSGNGIGAGALGGLAFVSSLAEQESSKSRLGLNAGQILKLEYVEANNS